MSLVHYKILLIIKLHTCHQDSQKFNRKQFYSVEPKDSEAESGFLNFFKYREHWLKSDSVRRKESVMRVEIFRR